VRVLEAGLAERGHQVEWSTGLVTFTMDDDGVTATVERHGTRDTIRAGWIVGCDGGRSTVRKTLSPDFSGEMSGLQGLACECDLDWKRSRDIWWTWQTREGVVAAIYNDFIEKWHVVAMELGRQAPMSSDAERGERVGMLLRGASGDEVRLTNLNWVRENSSSQRLADHFITKRAVLLGDAAHLFSSAIGHGVHCAIEDALNLSWKLELVISGAAAPSLLQTYEVERHGHATDVIRQTRWVQRFFKLQGGLRKALWTLLYAVGKHSRSLGNVANKQTEKLTTSYARSPLSRQSSNQVTAQTQAGLRVPDAACREGGRATRLFEVIRGPQADLLLFSGSSPSPETVAALRAAARSVLPLGKRIRVHYVFPSQALANDAGFRENDASVIVDGLERLHLAFGILEPEAVYLRPDGYIGLRSRDLAPRAIRAYLEAIYRNVETLPLRDDDVLGPEPAGKAQPTAGDVSRARFEPEPARQPH
jgi:2-polyprenyl-6-methoxyphenol hydroxylase-like FAD-dependent oxidoreductase